MTCAVELPDLRKRFTSSYLLPRMLGLGAFGCGLSLLLTCPATSSGTGIASGGLPALICGALTAVVGATLNLIFCAFIGACAFFTEDTSPIYWAGQKLSSVFDGLMFPLDMYPAPPRTLVDLASFPSPLGHTAGVLAGWTLFGVVVARVAFRRALRRSSSTAASGLKARGYGGLR